MEENLGSAMTLQNLADRLGYSLYYFIRLFRGVTGHSPKSYLNRRRITRAWEDLQAGEKKVIDLAYDYGFGTPESFSRAFHKQLGCNPGEVRRGGGVDRTNLQSPLTGEKLEYLRLVPHQEPELVDFGPLCLAGISVLYEESMPEDLSAPWQTLAENRTLIDSRRIPEKYYQVQSWLPNQSYGSLFFFMALEVKDCSDIPMPFTARTIPRQKYLRFFHRGFSNKVGLTYEYIYRNYLPETDYKLPHLFNFEYYPPDHKGPYDEESVSEIYIPVSLSDQ